MIDSSVESIIKSADDAWAIEKDKIITRLKAQLKVLEEALNENIKIESSLKDQVQENKTIAELSDKIQKESERFNQVKAIELQENILQELEKKHIFNLCSSIDKFKEFHKNYANTINSDIKYSNSELEFSVSVPFRKEAFISKVVDLFNNRTNTFRNLFNVAEFNENDYTYEFLESVITHLFDGTLQPKGTNTVESIMREIFDDWYGIKYNVKMDSDTIDVMSPGKKALVLLKLLIDLAESKCPILIDQPEDDLDNRSIFEDLIPFIKKKKQDRQIIIVTHNANVVLGADAEEVIVANQQGNNSPNKKYKFEYRSGSIENNLPLYDDNGNIEQGVLSGQGIQQHICDILEGGEKAFELRKKKYHI